MTQQSISPEPLQLPEQLTVAEVSALKSTLLVALSRAGALHVNGGAVTRVDGAGLQLLVALWRAATRAGHPPGWVSVSPALAAAARLAGLDAALSLAAQEN